MKNYLDQMEIYSKQIEIIYGNKEKFYKKKFNTKKI